MIEEIPKEIPKNENEMDPRTKDGQGLDYWASNLYAQGKISRDTYDHFIYVNSHKEEEIEKRGLPQLRHLGIFDSLEDLSHFLSTQDDNQKFIIRCSNNSGDVKRLIDSTKKEVMQYAKNLPDGFDSWKVELKEFTDTKESGTLIINSTGDVVMESWEGPHFLVSLNGPKIICFFNQDDFIPKYKWHIPEEIDKEKAVNMQERMLKIIRRFAKDLKPDVGSPLYLEYGIRLDNSFYVIEANDSILLTDRIKSTEENREEVSD